MKNQLLERLQLEWPESIKGTIKSPFGSMAIPIIGSIGDNGTHDIHPAAMAIINNLKAE